MKSASSGKGGPPAEVPMGYLRIGLLITGASTLALEILGSRLLAPYYGSSLYCWASLITVTLVALSLGYHFGGRAADRRPGLGLFAALICAAAVGVAVIPALRADVLRGAARWGIQWGSVASAAALLAVPLSLLGALGPVAVRLSAGTLGTVGSRAGEVWAISTAGSVAGAVLAGFVLIPLWPVSRILWAISAVLLALGAWGFWLARRRLAAIGPAAAVLLAGALSAGKGRPPSRELRACINSPYGFIQVADFGDRRYLLVDGTSQAVARMPSQPGEAIESDSAYVHALELTAHWRPMARKALFLGAGAGLLPMSLERNYGIETDVVEIDPAILKAAREHFGFGPKGRVAVGDARSHLEAAVGVYDIIILDAFAAESPPSHLFTLEAFAAARRALAPGGLLAVNIVSIVNGPGDLPWRAARATLRAAFPHARAFLADVPYRGMANVLLFASDMPIRPGTGAASRRPVIRESAEFLLSHEFPDDPRDRGLAPLTDDHAPLEFLLAPTALRWRRVLQETLGPILLEEGS